MTLRGALTGSVLLAAVCGFSQRDETSPKLPFSIGEKLSYDISLARGNKVGDAKMWIEGPTVVRGTTTYALRFDSRVKVALFTGVSTSGSWFDPIRKTSLRYYKRERSLVTHDDVAVELYPGEKRWTSQDGTNGDSPSDSSLDELSFIFFIRTLPLTPGGSFRFNRHFDLARNPVVVNIIRREVTATPIGELRTVLVEMRVRDPKHYKGEGLIRINLTDDECRLPARIESTMPVVGKAIMALKAENAPQHCAKR